MAKTPAGYQQDAITHLIRDGETFETYETEGRLYARGACPICEGDVKIFKRFTEGGRKGVPATLSDGTAVRMGRTCGSQACNALSYLRRKSQSA